MSEQEEDRVELKMRDAFGNVHYICALSKKRIEERLDEIWENLDTYVKEACKYHHSGMNTEILLNLEDGEVHYASYTPHSGVIFYPAFELFTIEPNIWSYTSWDTIFDFEEFVEAKEMLQNKEIESYEEYAEVRGIDLDERLAVCVEQWIKDEDPDFSSVREAIYLIYAGKVLD